MRFNKLYFLFILIISVIICGCVGERGHNGAMGINGENGINGLNNMTPNMTANMTMNTTIAYFVNDSYVLKNGTAFGQSISGGINNNENLTLKATANGVGYVLLQPKLGKVGIGTSNPSLSELYINGSPYSELILRAVNSMAFVQKFDWASSIYTGAYWNESATVDSYGSTSRGAFRIDFEHDADTTAQYMRIQGGNQSSVGKTVTWNTGSLSMDEDGNVYIGHGTPSTIVPFTNLQVETLFYVNGTTGNVSIGNSVSTNQFDITQYMRERRLGAGTLMTDANGVHYVISDEKDKTDVKPFTSGLTEILKASDSIGCFHFTSESGLDTQNEYCGISSAQKLREAIPQAVFEKKDITYEQIKIKDEVKDKKTGEVIQGAEYTTVEKPVLDKDGKQVTDLSVSDRPIITTLMNSDVDLYNLIQEQQKQIDDLNIRLKKLGG